MKKRAKLKDLYAPTSQKILRTIKMLVLDVDGVLTDGKVFYIHDQGWTRSYHLIDGYGVKLLTSLGFPVAIISAGQSDDVKRRMTFLGVPPERMYLGDEDKLKAAIDLQSKSGISLAEMAFIGDDLFDIPVLERVGFSATVPHAVAAVQKRVHYVTRREGGLGAVREVIEALRTAKKLGPYV